ncbi:MAG: peptidase M20, partial [Candidatus Kapaibacteriota bacterium]
MDSALQFLEQHHVSTRDQLLDYLRFPSVSTDPDRTTDVAECAEWLANHLRRIGLPTVTVFQTDGHPIVYAEHLEAGPKAPTVLMYGHYDVQP